MKKRDVISKRIFLLISIMLFISLMPFISPAPPVQTNVNIDTGYTLYYPQFEYVKQGSSFILNIYASNRSTSLILPNGDISCYLRLFNATGGITFESGVIPKVLTNRHSIYLTAGNFTTLGYHSYFIWCNSSAFGGEAEGTFEVTTLGEELTSSESIIYFLVTIFAFSIFFFLGWLFLNINGENPKDETGYLGINYRKYIKTALFPLVYVSFIWFLNFIVGLSNNYLGLALYSNTLGFIFLILMRLTLPVIIVTAIIELVLMVKDANIRKEYQSLWSRF